MTSRVIPCFNLLNSLLHMQVKIKVSTLLKPLFQVELTDIVMVLRRRVRLSFQPLRSTELHHCCEQRFSLQYIKLI